MMMSTSVWPRIVSWCAIISTALALLFIWTPLVPPSQDGGSHMLDSVIHASPEQFSELVRVHTPPSARGFVVPASLVTRFGGPAMGARFTLTFCLFLLIGGAVLLGRRPLKESGLAVIGACLVGTGWLVAMGFWNFVVGFSLGFFALGLWWRTYDQGWPARLGPAAVMLLAVPAHVAAAALMAGVLAAFSICAALLPHGGQASEARASMKARIRHVALDALCWVPVLVWSALIVRGISSDLEVWTSRSELLEWATIPLTESARNLVMCAFVSWSRVSIVPQVLAIVLAAGAAVTGGRRAESLMIAGCMLVAALTLILPLHAGGWGYASARLLTPALLAPLALMRVERPGVRILSATFSVAAVLSLVFSLGGALREGERASHAIGAFSTEPVGRAFVVVYHPEPLAPAGPYIQSMIGIGNWGVMGGGTHAGQFAIIPNQHNALFVRNPTELFPQSPLLFMNVPAACLENPECAAQDVVRADRVAASAVAWETLLISEAPRGFLDRLTMRGFAPITRGTWAPPEPASVRLVGRPAAARASDDAVIVIRASYPQTIGPFRAALYHQSDPADWSIDGLPAGTITVDAFIDRDGDRRMGPSDTEVLGATPLVLVAGSVHDIPLDAVLPGDGVEQE
jgi:hypothetical protein